MTYAEQVRLAEQIEFLDALVKLSQTAVVLQDVDTIQEKMIELYQAFVQEEKFNQLISADDLLVELKRTWAKKRNTKG